MTSLVRLLGVAFPVTLWLGLPCLARGQSTSQDRAPADVRDVSAVIEQLRVLQAPHIQRTSVESVVVDRTDAPAKLTEFTRALDALLCSPLQEGPGGVEEIKALMALCPSDREPGDSIEMITGVYGLASGRGVAVQVALVGGNGMDLMRTPGSDLIYVGSNRQMTIRRSGEGPAMYGAEAFVRPLVPSEENLEWMASCEWTTTPASNSGRILRFEADGTSGFGEVLLDPMGRIAGATATFGPTEFRRAMFLRWRETPQGLAWPSEGVQVSSVKSMLRIVHFIVESVTLGVDGERLVLRIPPSTLVLDERPSESELRDAGSFIAEAPELADFLRVQSDTTTPWESDPPAPASVSSGPEPQRESDSANAWLASGIALTVCVLAAVWAGAMRRRGGRTGHRVQGTDGP